MNKLLKFSALVFICFFFSNQNLYSQQSARLAYLSYVFPTDSLTGFNQMGANNAALSGGYFGIEYKVFMYRAKRNFINKKYGYSSAPSMDSYLAKGSHPVINAAPCVNEDFEASPLGLVGPTLTGWTISEGSNTSSCSMGGCCPTAGGLDAWIRNTPYVSGALIGTIPNSPLGGTKILQMNDNITNQGEVVRIQQTFPVTSTNALFQLCYMAEMDGSGHACCDQPYLKLTMLNCSNAPLACPSLSLNAPGASCASTVPAGWVTNSSGISWTTAWQMYSVDLTPYLGSCVTIQITVGDCDGWAHHGMAFVDMLCSPMTVNVNNIAFPVGATSNVTVTACSAGTATVSAPPGLQPYNWNGPGGSGVTNNPNQTFTTTVGGNYTLTMTPPGSCTPIVRIVTLTFGVPPIATFTSANACTTFSFTNTGTGPPAVQTYSFVGAGPPPSFTTTATTTVVNFAPSTTYTVIHTVTNAAGCTASVQAVINVPSGPNPAFTTPTYTQCLTGNSFVFSATFNPGPSTHTFNFNPTVGAPATGNTTPYGPVSFTAPGTYTVTHIITNSGCTTSASSVVVINPMPTVTANNNSPICVGGNVSFTSTGGGTYSWVGPNSFASAVQNPTITGITMPAAGIYTVNVNLLGCLGSATTQVTIATATAAANNTGPYCAGQTISLVGSAGTTYTWSGPSAFTSNLQSPTIAASTPAMSGTYNFTVDLGGCIANGSTNVTVNALPVPIAGNNGPICEGATLNLTGSASATYTWTGPNSFSSNAQSPSIPSASTTASGTYTFIVVDNNNCTNSVTTVAVVNPIPVPVIGSNSPICAGGALNLTSSGGTTYSWTGPNGFTSLLQNPNVASTTTLDAGVYIVTMTSAGCTASTSINVVISTGTSSANNTGPYCAGQTIVLNTNSGTAYAWAGPLGFTSALQNPTIPASTAAMSGVYSVTVFVGSCTSTSTTNVTVNASPVAVLNTNSPICIGNDINLTAAGGVTYAWAGPNAFVGANPTETITAATLVNSGTYTVTVTDANGCFNSTTAVVVVNPQPIVAATGTAICENSTAQLSALGGVSYSWTGPGGFVSAVQSPNIFNASLASAGQYTVLVTDANTCTNTAVATLVINPAPVPTINSNSPICMNDVLNLSATGGTAFAWTGPMGFTSSAQTPTVLGSSTSVGGIYQVTVTAIGGCFATATINTVVNPLPVPQITSGPNVGCAPLCVNFTVASVPTASTAYWTYGNGGAANGVLNTTACYNAAGIYTINATVVDLNGCLGQASYTAEVYPQPVADFNHAPIKPIINIDGEVTFTDASYGANIVAWNWYFMNTAQYTSVSQNPTFMYSEPGTYVVALVVQSDKGCWDTILRPLVVGEDYGLYVPNAFTPNSDGFNDTFFPKGFGIVKYELHIFDRWGEKVFHTKEFTDSWDGTFQGRGSKLCKEDVYTWLIDCTDVFGKSHELKGHVTLIR